MRLFSRRRRAPADEPPYAAPPEPAVGPPQSYAARRALTPPAATTTPVPPPAPAPPPPTIPPPRSASIPSEQPTTESRRPAPPAAAAHNVSKIYGEGDGAVHALRRVTLSIQTATFTAIMGPSGSGKSTLMHILAGLDTPTDGHVELAGTGLAALSDRALTELRRANVGFVFQAFNLLAVLSVEENVRLPLDIAGVTPDDGWIDEVLHAVRIADRRRHRPAELSGGQQQRAAIARAIVTRPAVIFADEPTGNLDSRSGDQVLEVLRRMVDELGQTVVLVTHDARAAARADRIAFLTDGELARETGPMRAEEILDSLKSS